MWTSDIHHPSPSLSDAHSIDSGYPNCPKRHPIPSFILNESSWLVGKTIKTIDCHISISYKIYKLDDLFPQWKCECLMKAYGRSLDLSAFSLSKQKLK